MRSALSVIKTHERNNDSEHVPHYPYASTHNVVDNVPSSVHLSVWSSVTSLWTLDFGNEWTGFNAIICINLPRGIGMNGRPLWSGGRRLRSQKAKVTFGSMAETSFSIHWVEQRDIQKCCLWKGCEVLRIVLKIFIHHIIVIAVVIK